MIDKVNIETVIIKDGDRLIRTFGELEIDIIQSRYDHMCRSRWIIHLCNPLSDDVDVNKMYYIELLNTKVKLRGYVSEDRKTIIED